MLLNRKRAAEIGQETIRILEARRYRTDAGKTVEIGEALRNAVMNTCSYPPDATLPEIRAGIRITQIEVHNETTLEAARQLAAAGLQPAVLNFASARHPGGGFLGGARAQEESLARSSGLYACLVDNPMYAFHNERRDPMYSHYVIYSPAVLVFRTDDGTLLEESYLCAFLTSPAVNAKVVLERDPTRHREIRETMQARIHKVLSIAAIHGHTTLVLGAWGCGVFGNDSQEIAELFHQALTGLFQGVFANIVFAVLDWSEDRHFIGPFLHYRSES